MLRPHFQFNGICQPVNIIAIGQVKCNICNNFYPPSELQSHLTCHIKPKFLAPSTNSNSLLKMKISSNMFDDTNNHGSHHQIKEMMVKQFPKSEIRRKKIYPYVKQTPLKMTNVRSRRVLQSADQCQITSRLGISVDAFEKPQILKINRQIEIPEKKYQVHKKSVKFYKNQNQTKPMYDEYGMQKKISAITLLKRNKENAYDLLEKQSQKDSQLTHYRSVTTSIPINVLKSPPESLIIKTTSRVNRIQNWDEVSEKVSQNGTVQIAKCQCSGCGGFYCNVCNSTIPPQYRPTLKSKNINQQIQSFWKDLEAKSNAKSCLNCNNNLR